MKKILFLILINFCLSIIAFGQNENPNIKIRPHNQIDDFHSNPKFILQIKNHSLVLEDSEKKAIIAQIKPNWIKSIVVIKDKEALKRAGYQDTNPIILIHLKRRAWKKLPKEITEQFEENL